MNLYYHFEQDSILTDIWLVGTNLVKLYYQKESFYRNLNLENVYDSDYTHANSVK